MDLYAITGDKALNFLFLLNQNIKHNHTGDTIQVDENAQSIFETVDRFTSDRILANEEK